MTLNQAPKTQDKYLFIDQSRVTVYGFGLISTITLMTGNFYFVLSNAYFLPYGLFVAFTAFYLFLSYLVGLSGRGFDFDRHISLKEKWSAYVETEGLEVDIFLPVCGEPIEVLRNTWTHVAHLRHSSNFCVFVLDDKKDPAVEAMAKEFKFRYITRPTNELKKAGNLRNAFQRTSGKYIAIFDADFCPRADFFSETIPYLLEDAKVAIVQTPQYFSVREAYTWIQNGAGAVQELFYRLIQVNRDTFNGAICVGTNAVYRRSALEPFGGTAPIPYSEDVHTGFQLISTGWKIKYLPIVLAEGLCPETVKQFFVQQYRWAMGSISLFFSKKFWKADITAMQTICYLTGMFYYMTTGLSIILGPIPGLIMLYFFPDKIHWFNLLFAVPSFFYSTVFMRVWMRLPMNMDVMRARYISYYAHFYALRDYLTGTLEEWKPTGASFTSARYGAFQRLYVTIFAITSMLTIGRIIHLIASGQSPTDFILVTFFLVFNIVLVLPTMKDI